MPEPDEKPRKNCDRCPRELWVHIRANRERVDMVITLLRRGHLSDVEMNQVWAQLWGMRGSLIMLEGT